MRFCRSLVSFTMRLEELIEGIIRGRNVEVKVWPEMAGGSFFDMFLDDNHLFQWSLPSCILCLNAVQSHVKLFIHVVTCSDFTDNSNCLLRSGGAICCQAGLTALV